MHLKRSSNGEKILFASSHEAPLLPLEEKNEDPSRYHWELTPYMNIYEADVDGSCLNKLTSGPAYHAECIHRMVRRSSIQAMKAEA